MNIRIEELKELANTLAAAVDSSDVTNTSECVELKTADSKLYLIISGSDYYVKAELTVFTDEDLHATVNASTLLKLISKTTATAVEFKIEDRFLIMKGNGTYKLPLIYDGDEMLTIPTPPAMEDICTTKFNYNTLESVSVYNSKELAKAKVIINPIQKLYLVDANGCVTFTTGACINSFDTGLDRPVFFSSKVVNLFKLFKGNDSVNFTLGKTGEQLKYKFESNNVSLTCVHPAGDISSYPVASIRGMANEDNYENKVILNIIVYSKQYIKVTIILG
mgnify:CR=1 FL=1